MRASQISAALVAALVGYGSTIALVLAAAQALGASPAQTASWVLAISLTKALGSAFLSWRHRMPLVLAWSTPGAALIAATSDISLAEAVGAFLLAALLVMITGLVKPLQLLVARIPNGIAGAMLAGVLLPFCLRAAQSLESAPLLVLPMVIAFAVVRLFNPAIAVLAALALGLILAFGSGAAIAPGLGFTPPGLTFVAPEFNWGVLIGLGLPLYLVTMASQNLPGFATVRAAGYEPPVQDALITTGALSAIGALFASHTINMAAITAAICLDPSLHPNRDERWRVGLAYAGFWALLGLFSPLILLWLAALPGEVMAAIVGLALLAALMGALSTSFAAPEQRFAATITLVTSAAGVSFFGIGAAFWGLLAGLGFYALDQIAAKARAKKLK